MPLMTRKKTVRPVGQKQSGFSLIEVMVTAVILSGSLLGIAQLQATSVRNTQDAFYRATANTLAYDIIDRMRANRSISAATTNYAINIGDAVVASDCESAACTPAQLAVYDIEAWKYLLANNLPGGDGAIAVVVGAVGADVSVTVKWQDTDNDDDRSDYTLNVNTLL